MLDELDKEEKTTLWRAAVLVVLGCLLMGIMSGLLGIMDKLDLILEALKCAS